jgi:hypothetical protein
MASRRTATNAPRSAIEEASPRPLLDRSRNPRRMGRAERREQDRQSPLRAKRIAVERHPLAATTCWIDGHRRRERQTPLQPPRAARERRLLGPRRALSPAAPRHFSAAAKFGARMARKAAKMARKPGSPLPNGSRRRRQSAIVCTRCCSNMTQSNGLRSTSPFHSAAICLKRSEPLSPHQPIPRFGATPAYRTTSAIQSSPRPRAVARDRWGCVAANRG